MDRIDRWAAEHPVLSFSVFLLIFLVAIPVIGMLATGHHPW